jgi:hypothetical protein
MIRRRRKQFYNHGEECGSDRQEFFYLEQSRRVFEEKKMTSYRTLCAYVRTDVRA